MRKTRITLFVVTVLLLSIGMVMIYSASALYAHEKYGDMGYFLKKHLFSMAVGIACACVLMRIDYRELRRYSQPIIIVSLLLLMLVLVPQLSREVGGAKRWFRFPPIQPSEFVKLGLIVYLADFFSCRHKKINDLRCGLLPPILILGAISVLILAQPDLGTAVVTAAVALIMFFTAGVRLTFLLLLFVSLLPVVFLLIFSVEYRWRRIKAFLNPWADPGNSGFQLIQSFVALGAGGLFGVGLGQSQQKLFYLPASHTDFIFAIIGEELGLAGTAAVAFLFIIFIWQGAKIALAAECFFGKLLAVGIVSLIGLEAIINMGVSTGILPTKGLPLPFLSYGGSALVVNLIAVGILFNIARGGERK